jgi:hypothetical protein
MKKTLTMAKMSAALAEETGTPCRNLSNLYLRERAREPIADSRYPKNNL